MLAEGKINVDELTPHPMNHYYFDDMEGDTWDDMLKSIQTSNNEVTNAITINQNKVIISGHQRVRACKVLGIKQISYKMIEFTDENMEIKALIESNLKQRVIGNPNPVKLGRCFVFLEKFYGIRNGSAGGNGSNQYSNLLDTNNSTEAKKSQQDLASEYGISTDTIRNYKILAEMIPELSDLVDTGIVTKTTALAMMKSLSETEQEELISSMDTTQRITQKQVQQYINENNDLKQKISITSQLEEKIRQNEDEQRKLKHRISELVQQGTKTEIVTQEVDRPETLQQIKKLQNELKEKADSYSKLYEKYLEENKLVVSAMGTSTNYQLMSKCSEITLKMLKFVKEMSQYDYMAESFNEIPNATRIEYEKCIKSVKKWADRILETINGESNIIDM